MSLRFGLRLKIVSILLAVMAALAMATVMLTGQQSRSAAEDQERASARQELQHLLLAFDLQCARINAALAGWSGRVSLNGSSGQSGESVAHAGISEPGLREAHLDWFALMDAKGQVRLLEEIEAGPGLRPFSTYVRSQSAESRKFLGKLATLAGTEGCGLVMPGEMRELLCFRPLPDSSGRESSSWLVLAGRHVAASMVEEVTRQVELKVELVGSSPAGTAAPLGLPIRSVLGEGLARLSMNKTTMQVDFPMTDVLDAAAGSLRLSLERTAFQRLGEMRTRSVNLLLGLLLVIGVVMFLVIDKIVVRRVEALRTELSAIVASNTWNGQMAADGTDEIDELRRFINSVIAVVREQIVLLRSLSHSDALTDLPNRRHFNERYADTFKLHLRNHNPLSLVLFDADCFKPYNDRYGHPNGDLALITIADCLKQSARRPGDLPVRLGGEEFALLLEDTTAEGALARAEAVLEAVVAAGIRHDGSTVSTVLTLSGGLAEMEAGDTPESLYRRADEALYQAKSSGRNRVCMAASAGDRA